MKHIWTRLDLDQSEWRKIFKALYLLELILKAGDPRCVTEIKSNSFKLKMLESFSFLDSSIERGNGIRDKAKLIGSLLNNPEMLEEERLTSQNIRNKVMGTGSSYEKYGGVSSSSYSRPNYSEYSAPVKEPTPPIQSSPNPIFAMPEKHEVVEEKKKRKKKKKQTEEVKTTTQADLFDILDDAENPSPGVAPVAPKEDLLQIFSSSPISENVPASAPAPVPAPMHSEFDFLNDSPPPAAPAWSQPAPPQPTTTSVAFDLNFAIKSSPPQSKPSPTPVFDLMNLSPGPQKSTSQTAPKVSNSLWDEAEDLFDMKKANPPPMKKEVKKQEDFYSALYGPAVTSSKKP